MSKFLKAKLVALARWVLAKFHPEVLSMAADVVRLMGDCRRLHLDLQREQKAHLDEAAMADAFEAECNQLRAELAKLRARFPAGDHLTRVRELVTEADGFAPGTSGEYKRHTVYARLKKEFGDIPQIPMWIEQVVAERRGW